MGFETILVDVADRVATIMLNRPDKLNALNEKLLVELSAALSEVSKDPQVLAAVLTGSGEKAFAAGADIAAMAELSTHQAKAFSDFGHGVMAQIEAARFPVIAAVNGFALGGGCELALACDFIYASDTAKFGQPEVNLGVIPGFGGTQRLALRVGIARARELCFTGDVIKADEALRIGLANAVHPLAEVVAKARATAAKIATKGPVAIAQAKSVLLRGASPFLTAGNQLEAQAFGELFATSDQREGMKAFLEKRPAKFEGR